MTRALLRSRTETKLLAQAAADKVGSSPNVTDAQVKAQYEKDKSSTYALPERRKLRHILVKDEGTRGQLYSQLVLVGRELRGAGEEVQHRQAARRTAASSA